MGLIGGLVSAGFLIYGLTENRAVQSVIRPESGMGDLEQSLQVEIQGERYPFDLTVMELPREEAETGKILADADSRLEALFLKENADLQHVVTDVSMPSVFPGTEISLQWSLDSWEYIAPDGTVQSERLSDESGGISLHVQAVLALDGQSRLWERELRVIAPETPDAEQKLRILKYQLRKIQEETGGRELRLPEKLLGEAIAWYSGSDDRWIWIAALTVFTLCAAALGHRKEEEEQQKKRERRMQLDYPDIVSRLSLYMGAGVSTRKAWERIVENYEKKRTEKEYRDAYEEMRTALHEMQSGISETAAYEHFGTRCRIPAYLKLGTLLSQNVRKGTKNLSELLQEEAAEAFEDRKALAKKMGEECESKLLFPMLLMLLTVLIMVMYPAVISFQM